ncbi:MAG: metal ABC transporter ATP-binding protein [archaeon]
MKTSLVEFKNVSFSYGAQPVLHNVNFSISKKDFFGIIGPNGGGKTTLIKLVLGFLKPNTGHIKLFGKQAGDAKELHRIGYVSQAATNFDHSFPATAFEVASMGRFAKVGVMKQLAKQDYSAIEKALADVDMLKLRNKKIGGLSGGQQQRVFIARALAAEPEILILDEPLTGVDMESQHKFYDLLKDLNKEKGLTIILVSHDVGMITKSLTKIACVNVNVTVHDVSKGIKSTDLSCAYPAGFEMVPHHHD